MKPDNSEPPEKAPLLRMEASQKPRAKTSTSLSDKLLAKRLEGGSEGKTDSIDWAIKRGAVQFPRTNNNER
ncbi:hypothetical protein MASR2M48_28410 [Spirochaetota bacterium]